MGYCKAIGLGLLLLSCLLGGVVWGGRYRRRVWALEEAQSLLRALHGELAFSLAPPEQLAITLLESPSLAQCDYLCRTVAQMQAGEVFSSAWGTSVQQSAEPFTVQDRAQLARVGEILGRSDLESQLSQIDLIADQLSHWTSKAREEAQTQAKLCTTLGALAGLTIVILLV